MASLMDELVAGVGCSAELLETVARQLAAKGGGRVTDALVLDGWADERAVLRVLALRAGTRFVTLEKLRTAKVEQEVLDRVPVRFAEAHSALPLKLDAPTGTLLVAAADPSAVGFLDELKIVSGIETVVALVALERGIQAAIRRFYYGDVTAFANLASETVSPTAPSRGADTKEASISKLFRPPDND
jgi:hypothetical protein